MYLGTLYIFTEFRPDRTSLCEYVSGHPLHFHRISARSEFKYGLAAILENQLRPITLELMTGSSPNFYNMYV
jgi:hypothetical protein